MIIIIKYQTLVVDLVFAMFIGIYDFSRIRADKQVFTDIILQCIICFSFLLLGEKIESSR